MKYKVIITALLLSITTINQLTTIDEPHELTLDEESLTEMPLQHGNISINEKTDSSFFMNLEKTQPKEKIKPENSHTSTICKYGISITSSIVVIIYLTSLLSELHKLRTDITQLATKVNTTLSDAKDGMLIYLIKELFKATLSIGGQFLLCVASQQQSG